MNANLKTLSLFTAAGGLLAAAMLFSGAESPDTPKPEPKPVVAADRPPVQIALLLDTSNSMDGLIEQAKSQLWKIVNAFEPATVGGKRPRMQIAVYEYGNDRLSPASGYIRQVLPLTEELDRVSEALFALSTNGGSEYAGSAIKAALEQLEWSGARDALKLVFIAGNEGFDQGPIDPQSVVQLAAAQGIIVNTIYCGNDADAVASGWKSGAALADGRFMTIDHNQKVAHVAAPQDAEIAKLGVELNGTYIPYGSLGASGAERQAAEDLNSARVGQGSAVQRAQFKASRNYVNPSWELTDAWKRGKVDLDAVEAEALPKNMQEMSSGERAAYVKSQIEKREALQAKIRELSKARDAYVAAERKRVAEAQGQETLDLAMIEAVKDQASKKGYRFE